MAQATAPLLDFTKSVDARPGRTPFDVRFAPKAIVFGLGSKHREVPISDIKPC